MDWEKDFLSWMKGEFALGLVPSADQKSLSVVLMVQASDRRAAEATFKRLDAAVAERKKQTVGSETLEGVAVSTWTDPATTAKTSHGWLNDNVAFLVLGPSIAKSFIPVPPSPLGASAPFKQATSRPEAPVNGHFYVNFDRTFSYPKLPIALQWLEPYRPWLDGIQSVGLTAVNKSDRSSSFDIQAILKRGQEPGPLPSFSPSPSPSPSAKATAKPSPKP